MSETICPQCHQAIGPVDAAFCPFCGEKLNKTGPDLAPVLQLSDPVKKHEQLLALQQQYPDDLAIAEEILHLGRLYQRGKKGVDFSIIKCYMLNVYLEPDTMKPKQIAALKQELFHHPDLDACLALAGDKQEFLYRYLVRLSEDFIHLFLQGSSRYMHQLLGFVNSSKAPKYLAQPAAKMLMNMQKDNTLDDAQRKLLMRSFYAAFASRLDGQTSYLDELLTKYNLSVETQ